MSPDVPDGPDPPPPDPALADEPGEMALVRAARGNPARLLALWRLLDARIVSGGHAAWGHRVIGHLLAAEGGLAGDAATPATWSAYLTTSAECRLRDLGPRVPTEDWNVAWTGVQGMADAELRGSLMVRIASGAVVQALAAGDHGQLFETWVGRLYAVFAEGEAPVTAPAQVAPVIAAVLACVDAVEAQPDPFVPAHPWLERLALRAADVPRGPERALALACVGRLARHRQDAEVARRRFDEACQTLRTAPERDLVPCLHWPRGITVPCTPVLDALRGVAGLEPVVHTLRRFESMPPLARTLAANRVDALHEALVSATRSALTGQRTPEPDMDLRVFDHDLAPPSATAHVDVLPRAASAALRTADAGHAVAGLAALDTLTSALDTCGNTAVAAAVRAAHGALARRWRLPTPATSTELGPADPSLPSSRAARHAHWRTRHAFDAPSRLALAAWGCTYLLADGPDGEGEWARASVGLDLVECELLGVGVSADAGGLPAPDPEDWCARHPSVPELAVRLWVRGACLGVCRDAPSTLLVASVGTRRAATVAEEEAALLALRLPWQAIRGIDLARQWFEEAHDPAGLWRVAVLDAMTAVRAGRRRDEVPLATLQVAHDRLSAALALVSADPLPEWHAVTTRSRAELISACGAVWVPWLERAVAVHRWSAHGASPESLFGGGGELALELRGWPRQAGA